MVGTISEDVTQTLEASDCRSADGAIAGISLAGHGTAAFMRKMDLLHIQRAQAWSKVADHMFAMCCSPVEPHAGQMPGRLSALAYRLAL